MKAREFWINKYKLTVFKTSAECPQYQDGDGYLKNHYYHVREVLVDEVLICPSCSEDLGVNDLQRFNALNYKKLQAQLAVAVSAMKRVTSCCIVCTICASCEMKDALAEIQRLERENA